MPNDTTCPLCACPRHAAPQMWEVRCAACRELRWPYQVERPGSDWTCARCRATPAETQGRRQAGARKRLATIAAVGSQTSQDSPGARGRPLGPTRARPGGVGCPRR